MKLKVGLRQVCVEEGEYQARVIDIQEGTFIGKRKILEFSFEIASGKNKGTKLRGWLNAHYESFSEYTKLYQWYCKATGDTPEPSQAKQSTLTIFLIAF